MSQENSEEMVSTNANRGPAKLQGRVLDAFTNKNLTKEINATLDEFRTR